jgi:hypothetical protein
MKRGFMLIFEAPGEGQSVPDYLLPLPLYSFTPLPLILQFVLLNLVAECVASNVQ